MSKARKILQYILENLGYALAEMGKKTEFKSKLLVARH